MSRLNDKRKARGVVNRVRPSDSTFHKGTYLLGAAHHLPSATFRLERKFLHLGTMGSLESHG